MIIGHWLLQIVFPPPVPSSRIVGMKRRLGLHGNVVAESPHPYQRAHRLATGRTPGGQPPWR